MVQTRSCVRTRSSEGAEFTAAFSPESSGMVFSRIRESSGTLVTWLADTIECHYQGEAAIQSQLSASGLTWLRLGLRGQRLCSWVQHPRSNHKRGIWASFKENHHRASKQKRFQRNTPRLAHSPSSRHWSSVSTQRAGAEVCRRKKACSGEEGTHSPWNL